MSPNPGYFCRMKKSVHGNSFKINYTKICDACQEPFLCTRSDKKTCSSRCRKKLYMQKKQWLTSAEITSQIMELYKQYKQDEHIKAAWIIY